MQHHQYFVYIITNEAKKVLYIGITNNLRQRITEHYLDRDVGSSFAGKYKCYYLLYFESFKYIDKAIEREKVLKGWTRKKKELLIAAENPNWRFLNTDIFEQWPPLMDESIIRKIQESE